jgi:hypothetical protein
MEVSHIASDGDSTGRRRRKVRKRRIYRPAQLERWAQMQARALMATVPDLEAADAIAIARRAFDDVRKSNGRIRVDLRAVTVPQFAQREQAKEAAEASRTNREHREARERHEALRAAYGPGLDDVTGRVFVDAWHALDPAKREGEGGSPFAVGMSAGLLVELAEDMEIGEGHFIHADIAPTQLMVSACEAALDCVRRAMVAAAKGGTDG